MANQYKLRVGRNIRERRQAIDKTMREIADKVGVTESTYQKYEAGLITRVDVEMLEKIANALGCTILDLTAWKDGEHEAYNDSVKAKRLAKHNKLYEQLTFENQKLIDAQIEFMIHQQKSQNTRKDNDIPK